MANPDKLTTLTEETINNGQSRQTDNIDRRDNQEWPI